MIAITRKTDSITDWLGGCGGFMEALKIVSGVLMFSYNTYALQTTLALNLVRFVPKQFKTSGKNAKNKLIKKQKEFR